MGLIECVSLIEDRKLSSAQERTFLSGLERKFSSGLDWLAGTPHGEVQLVDVGLALAAALDRQQAIDLK